MDSSDDAAELISHEAEEFYDEIRGLVVVFLFFAFFLAIAHMALQYFLSKPEYESKSNRIDRLVHQLVAGICTFTLTIGFTTYSLLPFSIIANEILFIYPQSYYVQWLNTELVQDLSLVTNIGLKISSILIPFSFFLLISQGLYHSSNSLGSRLLDAFINLLLLYILLFGTIWSIGYFLTTLHHLIFGSATNRSLFDFSNQYSFDKLIDSYQNSNWTDFLHRCLIRFGLLHSLDLIQVISSLIGLCLLSLCSPMGLLSIGLRLIKSCITSLGELTQTTHFKERLDQLNFETLTIMDHIQSSLLLYKSNLFGYPNLFYFETDSIHLNPKQNAWIRDDFLLYYANQLNLLREEIHEIKRRVSRQTSTFIRTFMKCFICLVSLLLLIMFIRVMESFVIINIVKLLLDLIFGKKSISGQDSTLISNASAATVVAAAIPTSSSTKFTLGAKPVSSLGLIGAFVQLGLIHFLLFVSLWGIYSIPTARHLRPKPHTTSLEVILVNIILFLTMSAALPLQANLLGLTTITLPTSMKTHDSTSSLNMMRCSPTEITTCPSDSQTAVSGVADLWAKSSTSTESTNIKPKSSKTEKETSKVWAIQLHILPLFLDPFNVPVENNPNLLSTDRTLVSIDANNKVLTLPPVNKEQSVFTQFISQAFGYSVVSPSYSLAMIIIVYNLCFLVTSILITGMRLGHATLSVVSSLRYLQQLDLTSIERTNTIDLDRSFLLTELSYHTQSDDAGRTS